MCPAQPIELAKLFVFLASADASYVSGEIFAATGGEHPSKTQSRWRSSLRSSQA